MNCGKNKSPVPSSLVGAFCRLLPLALDAALGAAARDCFALADDALAAPNAGAAAPLADAALDGNALVLSSVGIDCSNCTRLPPPLADGSGGALGSRASVGRGPSGDDVTLS